MRGERTSPLLLSDIAIAALHRRRGWSVVGKRGWQRWSGGHQKHQRRGERESEREFDCQRAGWPWATTTTAAPTAEQAQAQESVRQNIVGGSWPGSSGRQSRARQGSLGREDGCVGQWAARRRLFTSSKDALDECLQAAWARRYRRHDNFWSLRPGDRDPCRSTVLLYCWAPDRPTDPGDMGRGGGQTVALLAAPLCRASFRPALRYSRLVGGGCFRPRQRVDTSETYSDSHDTNRDALT